MKIQKIISISNGSLRNITDKPYLKVVCKKHGIEITFSDKFGANAYRFDRGGMFRFPMDIIKAYELNGIFDAEWIAKESYFIHVDCKAKHVPKYLDAIFFKRNYPAMNFSGMNCEIKTIEPDGSIHIKGLQKFAVTCFIGNYVYAKISPLTDASYEKSSLPCRDELCNTVGTRMQFFAGTGYSFKASIKNIGKITLGAMFISKCHRNTVKVFNVNGDYYVVPDNIDEITHEEIHEEIQSSTEVSLCEEVHDLLAGEQPNDLATIILMMKDMVSSYAKLVGKVSSQTEEINLLKNEIAVLKTELERSNANNYYEQQILKLRKEQLNKEKELLDTSKVLKL